MKLNWFMILLSLGMSALAGYGLYSMNADNDNVWLITIMGGITIYSALVGVSGFRFERDGHSVNIRLMSSLFLIAFIADNLVFSIVGLYVAPYIVLTGLLLFVYAGVAYKMINTKV